MKISKNAVLFLRITLNFLGLAEPFLGNMVFNLKAAIEKKKSNGEKSVDTVKKEKTPFQSDDGWHHQCLKFTFA